MALKSDLIDLILRFQDDDDVDIWKHEIITVQTKLAKSSEKKTFLKPLMQTFIGSASIRIISAAGITKVRAPVVCNAKIGFHESHTSERFSPDPLWDESVILPVPHLYEDLELSLYCPQKFAPRGTRMRSTFDLTKY
jgi:hypothetical protein